MFYAKKKQKLKHFSKINFLNLTENIQFFEFKDLINVN